MKGLNWKQRIVTILAFLGVCGIAGAVVMVSGIVPVKASSGHWEITRWILNFSKSRSVATHSLGIDAPPLNDPSLVLKGAGHFETGCVQCHGSPSRPASPIALGMTAKPPALPPKIALREPRELFYMVKHGIKFTGMPAWPALQRDDEVWAMTAFLLQLPRLDAAEYDRLSGRSLVAAPTSQSGVASHVLATCIRCHGSDGQGRGNGAYPRLAGNSRAYLLGSLKAYAAGERHSGMMQPVAAVLSEDQLALLADHFAALPPAPQARDSAPQVEQSASEAPASAQAAAIERGRSIAHDGIPGREVPSCVDCHGPGQTRRAEIYPSLSGQFAAYLALQLKLFRSGHRGGTASAHLMEPVVARMSDDDIQDVAAYYASLRPPGRPDARD